MLRTFKLTKWAFWLTMLAFCCSFSLSAEPVRSGAGVREASKPRLTIHTGSKKPLALDLELAATPAQWEKGLMFRQHLDELSGMLFIFPDDQLRTFWMKNTWISLDMLFIDKDLRIVGIVEKAVPKTLSPRFVNAASRYVLEVNGGFCERFGVHIGDTVSLQGV